MSMELRFGDRVQVTAEATFWGNMAHGNHVMLCMDNGREVVVHESEVKKVDERGFLDWDPTESEEDDVSDYDSTDEGNI